MIMWCIPTKLVAPVVVQEMWTWWLEFYIIRFVKEKKYILDEGYKLGRGDRRQWVVEGRLEMMFGGREGCYVFKD